MRFRILPSGIASWPLALLIIAVAVLRPSAAPAVGNAVEIQFLTMSDWHGQLDPLNGVGGAAYLSKYWEADRLIAPTLTLTAGDSFGTSPPLASFFEERPAVAAMNLMGIDADTLGNHNFDRGLTHLQQMIDLAAFPFLSANLRNVDDNLAGVKPFELFDVGGVKVAVIGITNPEAPSLVFPGHFGTIEVTDPVPAVNRARAAARHAGAKVFVVIAHLGVDRIDPVTGVAEGPLIDFANAVGGFDAIFGDHTDVQFSGVINNALVVQNRSKGLTYARTRLTVDAINGRALSSSVEFVTPVTAGISPDLAIVELLAPYRANLAAAFDEVIAVATGVFARGSNIERLREVPIGNLVADSMRLRYGAQLALTNGGGIRAPLPSSYMPADTTLRRTSAGYAAGPPYDLVIGDVFTVLPFGNVIVTRTVTGAQLHAALENGVARLPFADGRFPQISGFKFVFDSRLPVGARVISVMLDDGTAILPDATLYTLATNDFLNAGGDAYTMLRDGQGTTRDVMADVLRDYIRDLGTITPTTDGRITNLGGS